MVISNCRYAVINKNLFLQNYDEAEQAVLDYNACPCLRHVILLCQKLDPCFEFPSIDDLLSRILKKVLSTRAASIKTILPCLYIPTEMINDKLFVMILALSTDLKYIVIAESTFKEDSNFKQNLQSFCDKWVVRTAKSYNTDIVNVTFDYNGDLDTMATVPLDEPNSTYKYIRTKNLSKLLQDLDTFFDMNVFLVKDNRALLTDYESGLQALKDSLNSKDTSLGEAVEHILKFLSKECIDVNSSAVDTIQEYLNPFTF